MLIKDHKSTLVIIALLLLCMGGCDHSVSPGDQERAKLIGTWEWLYFQGDLNRIDPSITGYTEQVVFKDDGSVLFYRNDTLMNTTRFRTSYQKASCHPDNDELVIVYGDSSIYRISQDSIARGDYDFVKFQNDTMIEILCGMSGDSGYKRK